MSFSAQVDGAALVALGDVRGLAQASGQAAQVTLAEWAGDRATGLGARLAGTALARYGFTPRSPRYVDRVRRAFGSYLPYVSPRLRGYKTMKFLHGLTRPGVGHRVSPGQVSGTAGSAVLTVPAARALNFSRAGGVYAQEWGQLYPHEAVQLETTLAKRLDQAAEQWGKSLGVNRG